MYYVLWILLLANKDLDSIYPDGEVSPFVIQIYVYIAVN